MTADTGVFEVTLESTLKNVEVAEQLTQRVCETAGFDEEDQHKIEMAVHESVINAVAHGNKHALRALALRRVACLDVAVSTFARWGPGVCGRSGAS